MDVAPDRGWIDERDLPVGALDLAGDFGLLPPIDLDIGFGKGRSLLDRLDRGPEVRLLGVEVRRSFVTFAAARAVRRGVLSRLRILRADARTLLPRIGPAESVARAWFHFPDPWWKKRHQKRQVVSGPLLAEVVRLLVPGGEVRVQTDVPERAEQFHAALVAAGLEAAASAEVEDWVESNRLLRCREAGVPVHRLRFVKSGPGAERTEGS